MIVLRGTALGIVELERHGCIIFDLKRNEVIPHRTRSVNCRLCLQHEYHAYEYCSLMNKSTNMFLADQNVIQSLEQQFDYLFKCAGVTLMSCWDLKEHHIIIIINKNQKRKISTEFPQYFICLRQLTKFHCQFLNSGDSSVSKALEW